MGLAIQVGAFAEVEDDELAIAAVDDAEHANVLRPGGLADATDEAQLRELETLAELTERAWAKGCQVMVEGPGHVPFDQVEYNMKLQRSLCHGAPFYVLGPLVTDIMSKFNFISLSQPALLSSPRHHRLCPMILYLVMFFIPSGTR